MILLVSGETLPLNGLTCLLAVYLPPSLENLYHTTEILIVHLNFDVFYILYNKFLRCQAQTF